MLLYNPRICYLLTLREGRPCHLNHSSHKNIRDSLCIQFNNRKQNSCTTVPRWNFFLTRMESQPKYCRQLIHLSVVYTWFVNFFICWSLLFPLMLPLSSLPNLKEGKDILHLTLSSGISGTINSCRIAKEDLEDRYPERKIIVIDSLAASSGYGLLMDKLADLRDQGKSLEEVVKFYW